MLRCVNCEIAIDFSKHRSAFIYTFQQFGIALLDREEETTTMFRNVGGY
jgi:hypothetical protein